MAPEPSPASGEARLAALAAVAAPAFDALANGDAGDDERGGWIGPPPTRERIREQAGEECHG